MRRTARSDRRIPEAPLPWPRLNTGSEGAARAEAVEGTTRSSNRGRPNNLDVVRSLVVFALLFGLGCDTALGADAGRPEGDAALDGGVDSAMPMLDASPPDASPPDAGPPFTPPVSLFFVGNSFTFGGAVPRLVEDLAIYGGWPEPNVEYRAIGGQTLAGHRADTDPEGAPARVREGWDALVLQEQSTRPTDAVGDPDQWKDDATWFYDLAKEANLDCEVILYETWARRAGHGVYPGTWTDPAMMQAELRFHYYDAAERFVPLFSSSPRTRDVRVAPAGDAWEVQLSGGEPPRLHASDDYHAGPNGAYLSALVLYATIYRSETAGLVPLLTLDEATALELQASADIVSGARGRGPIAGAPLAIAPGAVLPFDFGALWVDRWRAVSATRGTIGPSAADDGTPTSVLLTTWAFDGTQDAGSRVNGLGLPGDVSRDSLWVGRFDGHAAALLLEARVVLRGLPAEGHYAIEIFASRDGNDAGNGRLTRYTIEGATRDLDVADNTDRTAVFDDVTPDSNGEVLIRVGVSPAGSARFAYIGAVRVTRL